MTGGTDGDARGTIEEVVAVHILDHNPLGAFGNQRIGMGKRGAQHAIAARYNRLRFRSRHSSDELRRFFFGHINLHLAIHHNGQRFFLGMLYWDNRSPERLLASTSMAIAQFCVPGGK
jgi:hypothetical protein